MGKKVTVVSKVLEACNKEDQIVFWETVVSLKDELASEDLEIKETILPLGFDCRGVPLVLFNVVFIYD